MRLNVGWRLVQASSSLLLFSIAHITVKRYAVERRARLLHGYRDQITLTDAPGGEPSAQTKYSALLSRRVVGMKGKAPYAPLIVERDLYLLLIRREPALELARNCQQALRQPAGGGADRETFLLNRPGARLAVRVHGYP